MTRKRPKGSPKSNQSRAQSAARNEPRDSKKFDQKNKHNGASLGQSGQQQRR